VDIDLYVHDRARFFYRHGNLAGLAYMSRALDDLTPKFRLQVFELIARCSEAGISLLIVDTLRTYAEQLINIANGVSWTKNSKHLPQPPDSMSWAVDVAPYDIYQLHGPDKLKWDETDPVWQRIGAIGQKRIGMKWGVVDSKGNRRDLGHFEYLPKLKV